MLSYNTEKALYMSGCLGFYKLQILLYQALQSGARALEFEIPLLRLRGFESRPDLT